ncbi:LCP family protein [Mycobacterium sp.]|uniref:LCP family protein n=1 Tax=Mycobacterium sp. TaxID=1785 RepID=UPI003BB17EE9
MSDGDAGADSATHGPDADDIGLSRTPPGSRGAAPWERFGTTTHAVAVVNRWQGPSALDQPVDRGEPAAADKHDTGGSHTEGVLTVADLIAKVGGPVAERPRHHRAYTETLDPEPAPPAHGQDDKYNAYALPSPAEYNYDLPDLDAVHRGRMAGDADVQQTTVLPMTSVRPSPARPVEEPDVDHDDDEPAPKRRRRHGGLLVVGRLAVATIAAAALAMTGGAYQWSTSKNHRLNTISALDLGSRDIVDRNAQFGDEDFLVVGMDSRAGANSAMGAGDTEDAGGARSDTIMLVNIPANRKRVVAVSFPRDLAITPIQCEAWNPDTGEYGPLYDSDTKKWGPKNVYTETKLNSTFSFGGPKCLVKEIQKLSGLSINRFIAVDFAGFAKMVDALGGVEVCSTTPLKDYELGTVLAHSGRQLIDSKTALNYVRARNVTTENNGDYGRIKRQQLFLSSLLRSLISKETFFSLNKLNSVVNMFISNSYVDNIKTRDLVQLGQSVQGMNAGHVSFVTVPTGVTDENGDEPPRTSDMRALFDSIINDDALPGENDMNATSSPPTTSANSKATPQANQPAGPHPEHLQAVAAAPQDVTVQVSNSTAKSGLATTASNQLKRRGFRVKSPDDYPNPLKSTKVLYSPGNEQAAATIAATFVNSKVERITGTGHVVQVVLGSDFTAVGTPPAAGSPVSLQVERNATSQPTKLPEDLSVTNAADTHCE